MVERPIKKSDRQPKLKTDGNSGDSNPTRERRSSNRRNSKGKGKKSSFKDEEKQYVNPALARPPKPPKPQANVETEASVEAEANVEAEAESAEAQEEKAEE